MMAAVSSYEKLYKPRKGGQREIAKEEKRPNGKVNCD
jgi:hypothetical protein